MISQRDVEKADERPKERAVFAFWAVFSIIYSLLIVTVSMYDSLSRVSLGAAWTDMYVVER